MKLLHKITSNGLAKNSAIVFVGTMISNVGAYLYHLILGRILGPGGYGELSSLISLLYIFGVPTIVLQTILVKYFSAYKAKNELGQAKSLYSAVTKILVIILCIASVVFLIGSPLIAEFLHLSSWRMLIWVCLLFVFSTLISINGSVIQGFQLFIWLAVLTGTFSVGKLLLSIPFSYHGVEAAMIAAVISSSLFYLIYFFPIRFLFGVKRQDITVKKSDVLSYAVPTFLALLGLTSLYSMDIVLARHFLSGFEAGIYASVAVLGKIIFYASSAIATVLFPVLAARHAKQERVASITVFAVCLVAGISSVITIVYMVFPMFVTHFLFGSSYDAAANYLGVFGIFISCYSVVYVLTMALLALEKTAVWRLIILAAVMQIALISFFHETISVMIAINIGVTGALLLGVVAYYRYAVYQHHHSGV